MTPLLLLTLALAISRAGGFGHDLLPLFQLNASYTNLNAGSYGVVPRAVTANATAWEQRVEANPDAFFRYDVWSLMDGVRKMLAAYIRCAWEDLVFVPNASAGVNTVLRSLPAPPGKKILFLNTAYGMVKSTIAYVDPSSRLEVNLTLPATPASVLATVEAALIANEGKVYLASFSHIASLPALVLPVRELAALCHAHGVLVLIDGAHALGHVPVDITAIDADFWLGNGHKWLCALRVCDELLSCVTRFTPPPPPLQTLRRAALYSGCAEACSHWCAP
jgi:selenocysteine lyase/cysteine desulfurase